MRHAKSDVGKGLKINHIATKELKYDLDILLTDLNHHLVHFRVQLLPLLELQDNLKKVYEVLGEELSEADVAKLSMG